MGALRKITVQVPVEDLDAAQALTGEGVTETVRTGLKALANVQAQRELRELRGKLEFRLPVEELRRDRE